MRNGCPQASTYPVKLPVAGLPIQLAGMRIMPNTARCVSAQADANCAADDAIRSASAGALRRERNTPSESARPDQREGYHRRAFGPVVSKCALPGRKMGHPAYAGYPIMLVRQNFVTP